MSADLRRVTGGDGDDVIDLLGNTTSGPTTTTTTSHTGTGTGGGSDALTGCLAPG